MVDGDVAATLARLAVERHITQIVIGKSQRSRIRSLLETSTTRRLLDLVTQDVHIVSPKPKSSAQAQGGGE